MQFLAPNIDLQFPRKFHCSQSPRLSNQIYIAPANAKLNVGKGYTSIMFRSPMKCHFICCNLVFPLPAQLLSRCLCVCICTLYRLWVCFSAEIKILDPPSLTLSQSFPPEVIQVLSAHQQKFRLCHYKLEVFSKYQLT